MSSTIVDSILDEFPYIRNISKKMLEKLIVSSNKLTQGSSIDSNIVKDIFLSQSYYHGTGV